MGMDVYGKSGNYLRRNVWSWSPLWQYVETRFPEYAGKVEYAYTNDGDGLGKIDSYKLGELILKDVETGVAAYYVDERSTYVGGLADRDCFCSGDNAECHVCSGSGKTRPFEADYVLTVDSIEEFGVFLVESEGFNIY